MPHSEAGDPDCCGCIVPDVRGDVADLVCNECLRVFERDVPRAEVNARLAALLLLRRQRVQHVRIAEP